MVNRQKESAQDWKRKDNNRENHREDVKNGYKRRVRLRLYDEAAEVRSIDITCKNGIY